VKNHTKSITQYLECCAQEKKLDPKTLKAYQLDLKQFFLWLDEYARAFEKDSLRSYLVYINKTYAASSARRKLASIKAYAAYLEEFAGHTNPFRGLKVRIHMPKRLPSIISTEDLNIVFNALYSSENTLTEGSNAAFQTARDRVVFELLIATGLRVSELCQLNCGSLSMSDKTIRIMGKCSKERIIQIDNENTLVSLLDYKKSVAALWPTRGLRPEQPFILNRIGNRITDQSVRFIIKRWGDAAGLTQKITPHMFRHTFATLLLESGVDIRYIQQFLGHSSIQTTEIYTHVASSKMRAILKSSNPRLFVDTAN